MKLNIPRFEVGLEDPGHGDYPLPMELYAMIPKIGTNNDLDHQHQKHEAAVTKDLICVISHALPFDPVTAEDGHLYERSAIEQYIARSKKRKILLKSPATNESMGQQLLDSPQIKSVIESLIENCSITDKLASTWKKNENEKKRAGEWLKKAENGNANAMYEVYNDLYKHGCEGFKKDRKLGHQWLKRAHEAGSVKATASLGHVLLGSDVPKNRANGLVLTTTAAKDGSNLAAYHLGCAFAQGKYGLPVDIAQAIGWLEKALDVNCAVDHLAESAYERAFNMYGKLMDMEDL